ncbi:MAG: threonine--tRNA ligase, partial [Actinobacteria bacterium]|nr:threonine--tRNA ligase [Actinomycetota bacterium]
MSPSEIQITLDGVSKKIEPGVKVTQVLEQQYPDQMKPGADAIIVCRINGELKDLWSDLSDGDVVESISISSDEGLGVLRHSTAHVLAQAVQEVFPETKLGIGPPIKDGFYYDFDPKNPFTPDDLVKLESAMKKIVKDGQRFKRRVVSDAEALAELSSEPYKCELVKLKSADAADGAGVEVGQGELTIYDNLGRDGKAVWSDLCRGPHLPSTKYITAYKLMRSAGAYWRGSEKNP